VTIFVCLKEIEINFKRSGRRYWHLIRKHCLPFGFKGWSDEFLFCFWIRICSNFADEIIFCKYYYIALLPVLIKRDRSVLLDSGMQSLVASERVCYFAGPSCFPLPGRRLRIFLEGGGSRFFLNFGISYNTTRCHIL
jgi:hypothetical protein